MLCNGLKMTWIKLDFNIPVLRSHFVPWILVLLVSIVPLTVNCQDNEILGCGGFIKSHADIDFSKVAIKLYTKTGSLKDQTECAPNTGYYFLPVYDKGEYVLKVDPPMGWSFEPMQVDLNFNGAGSDLCSQGIDINFVFRGFGITGRVVTQSNDISGDEKTLSYLPGPKGVTISLRNQDNQTAVGSTITGEGGTFSFTPIQPGQYLLEATHPVWIMEKHSTSVTVLEGNTELKDGELVVFGFDISGRVITKSSSSSSEDREPVAGVKFLLFGKGPVKNCQTSPIENSELCHVTSDETGRFTFPALVPGDYKLVPHYSGAHTKFNVQPAELAFTVVDDSLILPKNFKVTGFTVSGKVVPSLSSDSNGLIDSSLVGAKVFLSKKQIATTDSKGMYRIDNAKAGQYILHVQAENVQFEEKVVKISPSNPELPPMAPTLYKVIGKVSSSTKTNLINRKVFVKDLSSTWERTLDINKESGAWEVYLKPSKYQITVNVSIEEKTKGLQFFPLQHTIQVSTTPVRDVNFLQLKATLHGSLSCLKENGQIKQDCGKSSVTLKMVDGAVEAKTIKAKDGKYTFTDVLPGLYEVLVDTDVFCWENPVQRISVTSEKPPSVSPFSQTGFSVTFVSSHETAIDYTIPGDSSKKSYSLQLAQGSTRHCVSKSGKYEFEPKGCHKFPHPVYTMHTSSQSPVILSSMEHQHKAVIISPSADDGITVKISGDSTEQDPLIIPPSNQTKEKDLYKYEFVFSAVTGLGYTIAPLSDLLLFDPPSLKIVGANDCWDDSIVFRAKLGEIITGSISPALEGVTIKIFGRDKEAPVHTLVTREDGNFRVGPLDGNVNYTVTAEKEGFVLILESLDTAHVKFLAHKLAEINVRIIDSAVGAAPLQGVLISLSGGGGRGADNYRKNSMTGEDGRLTFNSLSPGEYYLRPMMKEYRFDPSSKIINVQEDATVNVELVGRRVAFSAYGVVVSLNGEPEPDLVVEAQGQGECANLQEEATSQSDGTWRIRGLEPKCMYTIKLKLQVDADRNHLHVARAVPSSVAVQMASQDVHDLRLIAIQQITRTDVSVHVISEQPEHYRSLKVKLCREDSPDSPIHVFKLDGHSAANKISSNPGLILHFPPLQTDHKRYMVQLESSLSRATHDYRTMPVYLQTNSSFQYVKLVFSAERRHDSTDANQICFLPLILIGLVTFAFVRREGLLSWFNSTLENWSRRGRSASTPAATVRPLQSSMGGLNLDDARADDIIVEQIKNINSKNRKTKPRKT